MRVVLPSDYAPSTILTAFAATLLLLKVSHDWFTFRRRTQQLTKDEDGNTISLRKIPTAPTTLPILGNLVDFARNAHRSLEWLVDVSVSFDHQPWKIKVPGQPDMIFFSSPEALEEITTTQFDNFEKGQFLTDLIEGFFGRGILAADGERWRRQRRTASKFFSAKSLRAFMSHSMHKNMGQVCDVLESCRKSGEMADLKKLFHDLTLQTFVEMGLGLNLQWIGAKERSPFQEALDAAGPQVMRRFYRPVWLWKLQRWLQIGDEKEFADNMAIAKTWLFEVIQKSLAVCGNSTDEDGIKSIVELFAAVSRDDADGIRKEDLPDFVLTFVISARDTTATTLAWLFYVLGKYPEVLARVREELATKLPAEIVNDKSAYITTEHIKPLVYLEGTIRELLRLYPAAPGTTKQAVRDTVVCGNVPVYKGDRVILYTMAISRNTHVWGPDATEFKPERWIDPATGGILSQPPTKFFAFHAGPRMCMGMSLALLELRVVAANLLHRFRFEMDPSNQGVYVPAPTLVMRDPLLAKVYAA